MGLRGPAGLQGAVGATGATGLQGPSGPTGAQGLTGAPGTNGADGTNGTNGATILNGTAPAAPAVGTVGDFYLETATTTLYGPKTSAGWPATGTNLVGPGEQVFTTAGTYAVPTGVSEIQVELWGGGGGGAAGTNVGAGSGGAGGLLKVLLPVSVATSCTVVVGAGGPGGESLGAGGLSGTASRITCGKNIAFAGGGVGGVPA